MSSSLTAEKYLSTHHILIYLEDAICQLLEQKVSWTGKEKNNKKKTKEQMQTIKKNNKARQTILCEDAICMLSWN